MELRMNHREANFDAYKAMLGLEPFYSEKRPRPQAV